jgi:ribosome-associated protein
LNKDIGIPEVNLELRSEPIVAKTRKLKAVWTTELAQDLNAYHSVDAEAELTALLSEYVSMEIDLEILDMRGLMAICDFFVICHGRSRAHLRAIAEAVQERLEQEDIRARRREGAHDATWVLLDLGSVVLHILSEEGRRFYDLERLWGDAPRVEFIPQTASQVHVGNPECV